jgi:N-acetyl-anhydromuramyl-L-alanine amidase AmpD
MPASRPAGVTTPRGGESDKGYASPQLNNSLEMDGRKLKLRETEFEDSYEQLQQALRKFNQRLQQELKNQGYNTGPIDGIVGPRTRAALKAFQVKHGLDGTGKLDVKTLREFGREVSARQER